MNMHELQAQLADKEARIRFLHEQLNDQGAALTRLKSTWTWRVTAPLRTLDGVIHNRILGMTRLDPVPMQELELQGRARAGRWRATGERPQFLLRPYNPAVMRRAGWMLLSYHFECEQPVTARVFVDFGQGFQDKVALKVEVARSGMLRIPVFLPAEVRAIRLEPASEAVDFRIKGLRLKRIAQPVETDANNRSVNAFLRTFEQMPIRLQPVHQISRSVTDSAHWMSHGDDPWFQLEFKAGQGLVPGWHKVALRMHCSLPSTSAKLYFDTGGSYSEAEAIQLPVENGQLAERVFPLAMPVLDTRFDPLESEGSFRIEALEIVPVDERTAHSAMLARLIAHEPDLTGLSAERALERIRAEAAAQDIEPLAHLLARYGETFDTRPQAIAYEDWIETVERPSLPSAEEVTRRLALMRRRPLISVLVPVYDTPDRHLRACLDSVLEQSYPDWELCIADDCSPDARVRETLQEYADKDARIRLVLRTENGHISRASNSALEIARGEFVALLDHDDVLARDALYFMAQAIDRQPHAQVLYSDEDKIDARGRRADPHFKSDWNPDLFFAQNYVSHLGVYRRALLERVGGFRVGVEGSQDHDLLLRCLPQLEARHIVHLPRVLYHWRALEGSTARAASEKDYTTQAGIEALRAHFAQHGPEGVEVAPGMLPNTYRLRWPIPTPAPLVSLLIPTRDKKAVTELAVRSILDRTSYPNYEILILDNGSVEPETLSWFAAIQERDARVRVIRYDHPFNFSAINNFGVTQARGSLIGLVNNDVEVIGREWLSEMVSHALREDIGCVGAKLYYGSGKLQHAGIILGIGGVAGHSHKYFGRNQHGYFGRLKLTQTLSAVTAACLVVRRAVFEQVGGLDEDNLRIAFNDVDFCLKVREAGYRNLWTPYAELYHHESVSRGTEDTPEKQARFRKEVEFMRAKWGSVLEHDPYYSPNLTRHREDFAIGE